MYASKIEVTKRQNEWSIPEIESTRKCAAETVSTIGGEEVDTDFSSLSLRVLVGFSSG